MDSRSDESIVRVAVEVVATSYYVSAFTSLSSLGSSFGSWELAVGC